MSSVFLKRILRYLYEYYNISNADKEHMEALWTNIKLFELYVNGGRNEGK